MKTKIGILSTSFCAMTFLAFAPIVASVAESFPGSSLSAVQMMVTLPSFMFILFSPLSGKLMQRFPKKKLALAAVSMNVVCGVWLLLFHSALWQLLIGSAIMGCGTGLLMPTSNAIICENYDGKDRGTMMGLNATFVAIGGLCFTLGSSILAEKGWVSSFYVFTLIIPVLVLIAAFLPKDKGTTIQEEGKSGFEMNGYVLALFVIGFVYFCLQNAFSTNSSVYVDELGLGGAQVAGLVTMTSPLGGMIGGVIFGLLASKLGKQIETAALMLAGVGFLAAAAIPATITVMAGGLCVGIAYALFNAAGTLLLSQHLKPENNAFTVSVYMAVVNLGAAVSPYVVNYLSGLFGTTTLVRFAFCAAGIFACAAASWFVGKK